MTVIIGASFHPPRKVVVKMSQCFAYGTYATLSTSRHVPLLQISNYYSVIM